VRDALSSDLALDNPSYRTPAHAARLFCTLEIWPEIGRKYRPIYWFPANIPAANHLKTNLRLPFRFHGMEEVVGSIPTRSTIFLLIHFFRPHSFARGVLRLRSGFRLRAPASLTPARRLKFDPDQVHQSFNNLADPPRSVWPEIGPEIFRKRLPFVASASVLC
jgi:hypothetical protein